MSKTQILMTEDNIDWTALFSDQEEKSIFGILRDAKLQKQEFTMLDNALQQISFDDYAVADMSELDVSVVLVINGATEKRRYDFLKTATGWGVVREFRGHPLPVTVGINTTVTNATGYLTVDVQGTGAGNDSVKVVIYANTKTTS